MKVVDACLVILYNNSAVDSFGKKGGGGLETFISLLVSVTASVIGHYICKWLDRNDIDS